MWLLSPLWFCKINSPVIGPYLKKILFLSSLAWFAAELVEPLGEENPDEELSKLGEFVSLSWSKQDKREMRRRREWRRRLRMVRTFVKGRALLDLEAQEIWLLHVCTGNS